MLETSKGSIKKCIKKQQRCQAIIGKDANIVFSDQPTNNIVICNAGLSNGLTPEQVIENFTQYGPISAVHMLPGKSYCYLIFQNIYDAEHAYNSCNGILNLAQDKKPLYLGYTDSTLTSPTSNSFDKPPGLKIIENVLTADEETSFLNFILNDPENNEHQQLKHRFVKHFGYEFKYEINNVDRNSPLKETIPSHCEKLFKFMNITPDQLTVNCYNPGQGIPAHVDTHSAFEGPIISLSLGSDVVMEFKHDDGRSCSVLLPRRSLTIMDGESRYDWTHGITPRKLDVIKGMNGLTINKRDVRVSYTFRKVNMSGVCTCNYRSKCDSRKNIEINDEDARKLEDIHVQQVYNNIASHFSDTRHTPWPNVLEFVQSFDLGSVVLDIGCGNGKNIGHTITNFEIGCDNSIGLLSLCRERNLEALACNCLQVPFKDSIADGILSIAVIHHLGSESRRLQAIAEIIRLLRVGGKALIYVWAKDQNRNEKSSYLKQDRKNRKSTSCVQASNTTKKVNVGENIALAVHTNRKQFAEQDMLVPWKLKGTEIENKNESEFLRFYHVFQDQELLLLVESFKNVNILKYYYDQGNWCVIFEKIN